MPFGVGPPLGSQNAAKGTRLRDAVVRALARYSKGDIEAGQALNKIADNVVQLAIDNDRWAIEFIADRIDGKPKQGIEHSGVVEHRAMPDIGERIAQLLGGREESNATPLLSH